MVMIPIAERYKYRCHFCGTNKSVKYLVDYYVSWMNRKAITVPCCNIWFFCTGTIYIRRKRVNDMPIITITKCYCDCCGNEIPISTKSGCFGEYNTIQTGTINCEPMFDNFDMSKSGVYLCEVCAEKMSHRLDVLKLNLPIVQEENKMLKIIPSPERNQYRCHFCDGKPVKYEMKCFDPVVSNKPIWVTCCNKCALFYNKDINSLTPEQMKLSEN